MDFSAISSVIQTVGRLLTQEATSLMGGKDQVEDLQKELEWMQSFLKEADARKVDNEVDRTSINEIRELAYDVEDVIETFALKVAPRRKGGFSNVIKRFACILNEGGLLRQTKCEIQKITARITQLTRRLQTYDVKQPRDGPEVDDESDCKVVSIWGMGGIGKTTLAKKIFRHSQVIGHFNHLAWVYVSQQFQKVRVWKDISSSLQIKNNADRDEELAEILHNFLKDNKCLVIIDDIWSIEAWDSLKSAFPVAMNTNSKFLLTFRNKEVVSHVDRRGYSYELQCLDDDESWKLFQKIAFLQVHSTGTYYLISNIFILDLFFTFFYLYFYIKKNIVDPKLEELGKDMVNSCRRLPLAISVLGGILATKSSIHEWQIMHKNAKSYLKKGKGAQDIEHVLALSYDDSPPYLRSCFLYLSQFLEDYQIRAERLIQLWVAEGIVSSIEEEGNGEIMEDVAEGFLDELVERCMVQVGERDPTLKVKTCHMHDLMRDLCLSIAKQENFSRIKSSIPLRSILFFWHPFDLDLELCLSDEDDFWWFFWFVCLILKWQRSWNYMFGNFKKLKVLSFEEGGKGYSGFKLSSAIGNLIHLRCLNLCCIAFNCPNIPSSLGNLRCLQTLDLRIFRHGGDGALNVPNIIWELEQLRHLCLPLTMTDKTKLKLHTLTNILTLINFNTRNCFVVDLSKFTKLRKLGILGPFNIDDIKEELDKNLPIIASDCLRSLSIWNDEGIDPKVLAHLLSSCVNLCELILRVKIEKLPDFHHFSSSTAYVHLIGCKLVEDPMPTLENLHNLRVLELYVYAFIGKEMVCSVLHFPKLESLNLSGLWNLEEWKVEERAVPTLHHLKISGCGKLKMLLDGLRFITTFQELKIEYMPKEFKDKMVQGREDFYKVQHLPSIIFYHIYGV
ncbi:probable disease resistance protein At1g58602 [Gossypium arboreum]|uniref:probable disease resistance protein At1g58602 n=1 Tax=Gossypium arboreum TaxID=29729 RepID=UPI0022F1A5C7|nr:probable disease resistance protein At1g58602 [Gossypium arboreum]